MKHAYKTAIIHDLITAFGGAENTLESIYKLYPSPIYTLLLNKNSITASCLGSADIITSFIQKLPWGLKKYRNYLPLYPIAIEQFDLREFDVILSSSFVVAKGVLTNTEQLHICYIHNPIRPAWELSAEFLSQGNNGKGLKGLLSRIVFHYLRNWDVVSANRVDYFIANSLYTAKRLKKIYNKESTVIYPPVDVDSFELEKIKEDYYVTASRLVYHKRIDIIVKAFANMPTKKLIILGDGPELKNLKAIAAPNIEFLGYQQQADFIKYLQKARAFIFAAQEDFGIAPIEAMACGTPVLAFGKGGSLETIIDGYTGFFFTEQNASSVYNCVQKFELNSYIFKPYNIRAHAEKFSKSRFDKEFKAFTDRKINDFFNMEDIRVNQSETLT